MPIYAWECKDENCGHYIEETWQKFIEKEDKERPCPKCNGTMELVNFAFGWKFCEKGKYIQDRKFSTDNPNYNFALKKRLEKQKEKELNAK